MSRSISHQDHIVEDVSEVVPVSLSLVHSAGRKQTHEMTTRTGRRRLENGNLAGSSIFWNSAQRPTSTGRWILNLKEDVVEGKSSERKSAVVACVGSRFNKERRSKMRRRRQSVQVPWHKLTSLTFSSAVSPVTEAKWFLGGFKWILGTHHTGELEWLNGVPHYACRVSRR